MSTVGKRGVSFGSPNYHNPGPFVDNGRLIPIPGLDSTASFSPDREGIDTRIEWCVNMRNYATTKFFDPGGAMAMIVCLVNSCECKPWMDDDTQREYVEWTVGDGSRQDELEHFDFLPKGTRCEDLWIIRWIPLCICDEPCEYDPGNKCSCTPLPAYEDPNEPEGYKKRCRIVQSYGKGAANPFDGLYEDSRYLPNATEKDLDDAEAEFLRQYLGFAPCVHCDVPNA